MFNKLSLSLSVMAIMFSSVATSSSAINVWAAKPNVFAFTLKDTSWYICHMVYQWCPDADNVTSKKIRKGHKELQVSKRSDEIALYRSTRNELMVIKSVSWDKNSNLTGMNQQFLTGHVKKFDIIPFRANISTISLSYDGKFKAFNGTTLSTRHNIREPIKEYSINSCFGNPLLRRNKVAVFARDTNGYIHKLYDNLTSVTKKTYSSIANFKKMNRVCSPRG